MALMEDALKRAKAFAESDCFDEETRSAARAAMEDEQELLARFDKLVGEMEQLGISRRQLIEILKEGENQ